RRAEILPPRELAPPQLRPPRRPAPGLRPQRAGPDGAARPLSRVVAARPRRGPLLAGRPSGRAGAGAASLQRATDGGDTDGLMLKALIVHPQPPHPLPLPL